MNIISSSQNNAELLLHGNEQMSSQNAFESYQISFTNKIMQTTSSNTSYVDTVGYRVPLALMAAVK